MTSESHYRKLERMYLDAPTNEYYRPEIHISEGRAEVAIEVREEFYHALSAVHGSVYFKLLDDAAFFAVASLNDDVLALTVSFNIYITGPVSEGVMRAQGEVVRRTGRLFLAQSVVTNARGEEIGRGSGMFSRTSHALSEADGYG